MLIDLPKKIRLNGRKPEDLTGEEKTDYLAYYAERDRRDDPSIEGVAAEALACIASLEAENRSPRESFTQYGYSNRSTVRPARAEEDRIVRELSVKPSQDVVQNPEVALVVSDVKDKYAIEEWVEPKEPVIIEEPIDPKDPKEPVVIEG